MSRSLINGFAPKILIREFKEVWNKFNLYRTDVLLCLDVNKNMKIKTIIKYLCSSSASAQEEGGTAKRKNKMKTAAERYEDERVIQHITADKRAIKDSQNYLRQLLLSSFCYIYPTAKKFLAFRSSKQSFSIHHNHYNPCD